jgi:DNA-binding transcriptional MerR regulator
MYDETAVKRLEQILILRKLNIGIKDIQRIFNDSGSNVVLEVLGKKVQGIDDEVALLNELKVIVLDFIREIERLNFAENADVKRLYDKAKEIETHLKSVDYIGKPSNVNRLIEITDKLDKKIPGVMIVRIPRFRAVISGYKDYNEVFELMSWAWKKEHRDFFKDVIFNCADFLKRKDGKFEYMLAVRDNISERETSPYKIEEFEGGLYALAVSIDGDDESINKVEDNIFKWLEGTRFEYDDRRDVMGQMTYCDDEIKKGLGYEQLQRYVPIKVKENL